MREYYADARKQETKREADLEGVWSSGGGVRNQEEIAEKPAAKTKTKTKRVFSSAGTDPTKVVLHSNLVC